MKCLMCNANIRPVVMGNKKLCPRCGCYIGTFEKPSPPPASPKVTGNYHLHFIDRPKEVKGKYQPHLVLGSLTRAIARVREYGVRKYHGEDGWKQQTAKDYMDAIGRHYDECRNDPESRDVESGLLHIAQIATNAMFVIQMLKEQGIDLDSMKEPPSAK